MTNEENNTVLLSAECWQGAMIASQFAGKYLYRKDTELVLFQTYLAPSFGMTTMRNLDPILKKIAKEDLTVLKDKLIGDFGIPAEKIQKKVVKGELDDLLKAIPAEYANPALVIGSDNFVKTFSSDACGKIIRKFLNSSIRPIFFIMDSITIFEEQNVIIVSESENPDFLSFYKEIAGNAPDSMVIITNKNEKRAVMNSSTKKYFSEVMLSGNQSFNQIEKLFNERVLNSV